MLALPAHSRRCFLQASRGTARQAKGARRPPPAANQSRHVATGGAAAAGVASPPLVREPGIAGQLGSGRGLGQISLPMGLWGASPERGGVRCLRLAGLLFLPGNASRGECSEAPAATPKFPFSSPAACVIKGWH